MTVQMVGDLEGPQDVHISYLFRWWETLNAPWMSLYHIYICLWGWGGGRPCKFANFLNEVWSDVGRKNKLCYYFKRANLIHHPGIAFICKSHFVICLLRMTLLIGHVTTVYITSTLRQMLIPIMPNEASSLPTVDGSCARSILTSKQRASMWTTLISTMTLSVHSKKSKLTSHILLLITGIHNVGLT